MNKDDIILRLRERQSDLQAHGVLHAALFGSMARSQANGESDIDILVDLDPKIVSTMFDYAGVKSYIAGLFNIPVDVVDREAMKPHIRSLAYADAINAF